MRHQSIDIKMTTDYKQWYINDRDDRISRTDDH